MQIELKKDGIYANDLLIYPYQEISRYKLMYGEGASNALIVLSDGTRRNLVDISINLAVDGEHGNYISWAVAWNENMKGVNPWEPYGTGFYIEDGEEKNEPITSHEATSAYTRLSFADEPEAPTEEPEDSEEESEDEE